MKIESYALFFLLKKPVKEPFSARFILFTPIYQENILTG